MNRRTWLLILAVACSTATNSTTAPSSSGVDLPPDDVAADVATALDSGDPLAVANLTDLRPMPWVALAEGATVEQAATIAKEEAVAVASNFWTGFLDTAGLGGTGIGSIEAFTEGDTNFARLDLGAGSIVLNQADTWRIDVIASFGAPLAERLLSAVEVIVANRSSEADLLREMLRAERDAVSVAIADPAITSSARIAVEEVLAAIDTIDG